MSTGTPVLVYAAAAAWGLAFGSSPSLFIGAVITASITWTVLALLIAAAAAVIGGRAHAFP
ncbi:hypothetical protein ACFY36_02325 [Actinoplanes sp. NPDC000266]